MLGEKRAGGGQVGGRVRSRSRFGFRAVEQRLEHLDRRRVGTPGEAGIEDRDRLRVIAPRPAGRRRRQPGGVRSADLPSRLRTIRAGRSGASCRRLCTLSVGLRRQAKDFQASTDLGWDRYDQRMTLDLLGVTTVPETLATWVVPGGSLDSVQEITARAGEVTAVVGANGAGKSALGLWMQNNSRDTIARRLIAHRRLWFTSAGPDISPAQRESMIQNMQHWSFQQESRYLDHADSQRANIVLFDILALVNGQNSRIADLAFSGIDRAQIYEMVGARTLDRLNAILMESGLPVQLVLTDNQTFNAVNASRGTEYPIFQMSDGEKSAVLLASEILTASPNSIQIIDEPERHLHRSISSGLVEALTAARPDCHFVVLTHDLELANSLGKNDKDQTFVLTGCAWSGSSVTSWDIFAVEAPAGIPDNARTALLGGRRDVLFIEGAPDSLDKKLYSLLFPLWGLSPSGGCEQVVRAVTGLQASEQHHWIRARGMVDGDGRTPEERASLLSRGILPLPVSEIESLYYLDVVIREISEVQAAGLGRSSRALEDRARRDALSALRQPGIFERLARKLALSEVRRKIVDQLPAEIEFGAEQIDVSFLSPYPRILEEIKALSLLGDLEGLVRFLPIRDTGLRNQVAAALGFRSFGDYESAVRVRIKGNPGLASALRDIVGPVPVGA